MEKKLINLKSIKNIKLEINEQEIEVNPYITPATSLELAQDYLRVYFSDVYKTEAERLLSAEWWFMMGIVNNQTTIPIQEDNMENISLELLVTSGTYTHIKEVLYNYNEVKSLIDKTLENAKKDVELEKSVGESFNKIATKVIEFLDKISQVDISEKGISDLVAKLNTTAQKYEEKFGAKPKRKKATTNKDLPQ